MSIYSSVSCPRCNVSELSLATAYSYGKIRLSCDACGFDKEIDINEEQEKILKEILEKLK